MQDGCKAYMDGFLNGIEMDHVSWSLGLFLKNHVLEVGLTQNVGDHNTPNAHNHWFILIYHVRGCALIFVLFC